MDFIYYLLFIVVGILGFCFENRNRKKCDKIVNTLRKHCKHYKVLGFDCEGVSTERNAVALLQLASPNGFCGLFRLSGMSDIPKSLQTLLEDQEIIKVGVDAAQDAQKLQEDYGIHVASTFDVRHLSVMIGCRPWGLKKLSQLVLNVNFTKYRNEVSSNWEAGQLSEEQINYAANDAFASVEIFKHLANRLVPRDRYNFTNADFNAIKPLIRQYLDNGFSENRTVDVLFALTPCREDWFLQAPNGELLCNLCRHKAMWYLEEGLGKEIRSEALTIRLYDHPFAEDNGYWQTPNQHACVVCGQKDAFVCKGVVPTEYRMHFPLITQFFTSSDVLHLCPKCNVSDIISDIRIRTALSQKCDAPYSFDQVTEVKRAAETLLTDDNAISTGKRNHLKTILSTHFEEAYIDHQRIVDASIQYSDWPEYEHGERVVNKFQTEFGGLQELEILLKDHFVTELNPKYLPSFWDWPIDWKYKPEKIMLVSLKN
ncbi:exonuclease 3'-5' domain-containing protein 2-like [Glossina fuscipes]|uniref:Exonuclease 3'-5' domain-containing protein 2-like n=1 Tax=Glossina fuscipes TaxID=7396 RepID=A0A9C5Z1W5_9MUSC|nr:exonuclease 3'-5' domain-containing protein 2-like [Glossina fuscipes]